MKTIYLLFCVGILSSCSVYRGSVKEYEKLISSTQELIDGNMTVTFYTIPPRDICDSLVGIEKSECIKAKLVDETIVVEYLQRNQSIRLHHALDLQDGNVLYTTQEMYIKNGSVLYKEYPSFSSKRTFYLPVQDAQQIIEQLTLGEQQFKPQVLTRVQVREKLSSYHKIFDKLKPRIEQETYLVLR